MYEGSDRNYGSCLLNWSDFFSACWFSSASEVERMINHGADLNAMTNSGLLPIQLAFNSGDEDKMNLFLNRGISVEDINRLGLLHFAAKTSINIIKRLVQRGADVNGIFNYETVICRAVSSRNLEVVKFLAECGADFNTSDVNGASPLETAVSMRDTDIVKILLENGANVNLGGEFELAKAIRSSRVEIVKLLVDYGANIEGREGDGKSLISVAACSNRLEMVKFILDKGAKQEDGVFIYAVTHRKRVTKLLLEAGWNPNCKGSDDFYGAKIHTALSWAVFLGDEELTNLLLDYGARVDGVALKGGKTPLHLAILKDHFENIEMVQLLLNYGANINKRYKGETPLTMAIQRGFPEVRNCLVRHMMLIKAQDCNISEKNLNACKKGKRLEEYRKACEEEIEILRTSMFRDTNVSYLDILATKNVQKLASLANNQNISEVFKSNCKFNREFPIYWRMTVNQFEKGISRNKDFELFGRFIDYLSARDHDQLPKVPLTVASEMFSYLNDRGLFGLRQL